MKFFEKFIRKEASIKALRITDKLTVLYLNGKTHRKKVFFKEKNVAYFISFFNIAGNITVEIDTLRGKLIANHGDWIVKEINNNYSVYTNEEFIQLTTHNRHGNKNKN
ncbi:MAG: hypothetical protein AABY22_09305 [Nanoarchaeota archaeon]